MWILGKIYQEMVVLIFMLKQIITYYESKSALLIKYNWLWNYPAISKCLKIVSLYEMSYSSFLIFIQLMHNEPIIIKI